MKAIFKISFVLLFVNIITGINLYAQQTIILRDKNTQLPVTDADYQSGSQKGHSDKYGMIQLTSSDHKKLIISHISYETLELNYNDIKVAIQKGWIELTPSSAVYLNPVTLYALKGKAIQETVRLNNGDWVQHDASQVLQQIPGFSSIKKSGAFGFDPVFRGFKLDQLNILNDGALTSTAACPNRMDPPTSQVLISQVQQIEVLKGPHSFRYGPSMGAVINFKTAAPEFSNTTKPFGRITTGYESNGEIYRTEGVIGIRTKKMQITATGSYSKGHNYKDGNDSIIPAGFSRGSVGLNANIPVKSNQLLIVSATRNFARKTDFPVLMMDLLSDDTWMLQGQYKITGENTWYSQWNTQFYASFVDHSMGNKLRPASTSMQASVDATTNTKGGRTEFSLFRKKSQLFFGADMKYETANGDRFRKMLTGPRKNHIISPKDEFIDLDAEQYKAALQRTIEFHQHNNKEYKNDYPKGDIVRNEFRDPKNPLLLIYFLDPEGANLPKGSDPLVGFAISFPGSRFNSSVRYAIHKQLLALFNIDDEIENDNNDED
ncbi:MAG TPA: TonB-dependent receptor plug domain-containing protein [Hanamia sp.]